MTKNKERGLRKSRLRIPTLTGDARKRFVKVMLTLLAAFLTFGGPTYVIYVLKRWVTPHVFLILLGLASLTAGLILFMRLMEEGKTEAST